MTVLYNPPQDSLSTDIDLMSTSSARAAGRVGAYEERSRLQKGWRDDGTGDTVTVVATVTHKAGEAASLNRVMIGCRLA